MTKYGTGCIHTKTAVDHDLVALILATNKKQRITLVIQALELLKRNGYSVVIAASGKKLDPNNPDYFEEVDEQIKREEVVDEFRLLGMIPYADVASLIVRNLAVSNPSLYEGLSTTVEEA